jgi:hypothetical protein
VVAEAGTIASCEAEVGDTRSRIAGQEFDDGTRRSGGAAAGADRQIGADAAGEYEQLGAAVDRKPLAMPPERTVTTLARWVSPPLSVPPERIRN